MCVYIMCAYVCMRQASYPCDLKNCSSMGSVFNLCATVLATWQTQTIECFIYDTPLEVDRYGSFIFIIDQF